MNRRIIYIIFLAVGAYIIYNLGLSNPGTDPIANIDKKAILQDFSDLRDNNVPPGTLGGSFYPTYLFFPKDFQGKNGDEFYLSMEDGHIMLTQKYIIQPQVSKDGKPTQLLYQVKDTWENYRPPLGKFETYSFNGEIWNKEESPETKTQKL